MEHSAIALPWAMATNGSTEADREEAAAAAAVPFVRHGWMPHHINMIRTDSSSDPAGLAIHSVDGKATSIFILGKQPRQSLLRPDGARGASMRPACCHERTRGTGCVRDAVSSRARPAAALFGLLCDDLVSAITSTSASEHPTL